MSAIGFLQVVAYLAALLALAKPLGDFMARALMNRPGRLDWLLRWPERAIYRALGPQAAVEMTWKHYAVAILTFNALGLLTVYGLQRLQWFLPLNPQGFPGVGADSSFNTAISFASNTNWQGYGGESTMSYLTQMLGLAVQNFLSAATGIAVLAALARGFSRRSAATIGNAWQDLVRSTLYILLPVSLVWSLALVSQGVVQNFEPYRAAALMRPIQDADGKPVAEQSLPQGPAASQVAIKQLGTNGGGFFNVNSAHPYENPTPLSNFLEVLAILVIPAALCRTFGVMVGDPRQGWALLAAMTLIFAPLALANVWAEESGVPALAKLGVDPGAGQMEGKEVRFGPATSALWATVTTAASNGSVNAMHDSFTPLGGLIPMWLMQLGEVVFGGAGSGLYGMLMFALIAVFVAGLMVGRTPEYLGKKIEAFEMKMAALVVLIPAATVLIGTAIAVAGPGLKSLANPGPHGFSEALYAFSSAANNNGSAFGGLSANVPFYNIALGLAMFFGRYLLIIPVLAVAGALARKGATPASSGTLPTHTPLFVLLLAGTVVLVGALTFVPALALGPIVEHLQMIQG